MEAAVTGLACLLPKLTECCVPLPETPGTEMLEPDTCQDGSSATEQQKSFLKAILPRGPALFLLTGPSEEAKCFEKFHISPLMGGLTLKSPNEWEPFRNT